RKEHPTAKPSPAVAACSEAEAIEVLESAEEEGFPGAAEDVMVFPPSH
uniref:Uncharacterized protein n=1 Tax=Pseudonaja textilis TaxID=8673 RepID=A0A670YCB0_PSETE